MLHPLKEFMSRKKMIREGNMVDGLLALHAAEKDGIEHFVEQFLLRKIIYRHQMVAIRKMGNGSQSTHKFIIEEQYIRFIRTDLLINVNIFLYNKATHRSSNIIQ